MSERFPYELRLFLKKMQDQNQNFKKNYENEILMIKNKINYQEAIIFWKGGDKIKARNFFLKNLNLRNIFLFIMTFLPYSFFNFIYKWKNGL